jgi:hypothetical protein
MRKNPTSGLAVNPKDGLITAALAANSLAMVSLTANGLGASQRKEGNR